MGDQKCLHLISVYLKGDGLDPEDLTVRLGTKPTRAHAKGERWTTPTNGEVVEKTGL